VDDRDVLDETYRKAGKMDRTHFAARLEEEVPKILNAIRPVLFTDGEEKTNIRAELYKLNVYGLYLSFCVTHPMANHVLSRRGCVLQAASGHAPRQDDVRLARHRLPDASRRGCPPLL
jgi:hypothetical protein